MLIGIEAGQAFVSPRIFTYFSKSLTLEKFLQVRNVCWRLLLYIFALVTGCGTDIYDDEATLTYSYVCHANCFSLRQRERHYPLRYEDVVASRLQVLRILHMRVEGLWWHVTVTWAEFL
jgi:hypothetical protein